MINFDGSIIDSIDIKYNGIKIALALRRKYGFMKKVIIVSFPFGGSFQDFPVPGYKVFFREEIVSIFKAVEYMEKNFYDRKIVSNNAEFSSVMLRNIINLHELSGTDVVSRIRETTAHITSGRNILVKGKWPLIKLVQTVNRKLVLFSGHHALLAYMAAGRRVLGEVPHLYVHNEERNFITNEEMHEFFGRLGMQIRNGYWKGYTIKWKKAGYRQIQRRATHNMGELFDSLKAGISL
jgi:hypothetical protein